MDNLEKIRLLAKANTDAVGFLPFSRIEERAAAGTVFHQVEDGGEWVGYLITGPIRPGRRVFVWQECIEKSARGYGSGARLFGQLLERCREVGAYDVVLRCAADLPAVEFWRAMGFEAVRITHPENRRKRAIITFRQQVTADLFSFI